MAHLTVSDWRSEPDQLISESTRRLLAWQRRLHESEGDDTEDVAARVALGLRELTDAQTVAVFARCLPGDALCLLAVSQQQAPALDEGFEDDLTDNFDASSFALARFPAPHLWAILPHQSFFVTRAQPALQVTLGEICDWVNTFSLSSKANDALSQSSAPPGEPAAALPALGVPLRAHDARGASDFVGVALLWIANEDGLLPQHLQAPLEAAGAHAGDALSAALRLERLGKSYRDLAALLATTAERREPQRAGHAQAVSYYAGLIAREMGLPHSEVERIEFAALLHEIGKLSVPDAILQKEERLTPDELELVRSSVISGADWLAEVEGLDEVAQIVRHQNERFDGGGLPGGLVGEEIPLGARILAVALRFTAMTQPRADRRPIPVVGGAVESLAEESGSALDPVIVQAFLKAVGRRL
jgi:HD-GYP domain-containing protein (c-di-GMP phosphodiesterase class II)